MQKLWTNILLGLGIVAAWIYALWRERRYGRTEQKLKDQIKASQERQALERKSGEVAEQAASRSDPLLHGRNDVVRNGIPEWSRRD